MLVYGNRGGPASMIGAQVDAVDAGCAAIVCIRKMLTAPAVRPQ
jgi:hypothetical protein